MDVPAMERHLRRGGVEVFIFQLAQGPAVGGISEVRPEILHMKPVRSPADFFIGGEADAQCGVGPGRSYENFSGCENLGDAGFAPRRVVPSVTIKCLPRLRVRLGKSDSRMTMCWPSWSKMSPPS